jgi:hypothetical protein
MIKANEALAKVTENRATKENERIETAKTFCETEVAEEIKERAEKGYTTTNSIPIPPEVDTKIVEDYLRKQGYAVRIQWGYKNAYVCVDWDKPTA